MTVIITKKMTSWPHLIKLAARAMIVKKTMTTTTPLLKKTEITPTTSMKKRITTKMTS